jgi:hypothetical protein
MSELVILEIYLHKNLSDYQWFITYNTFTTFGSQCTVSMQLNATYKSEEKGNLRQCIIHGAEITQSYHECTDTLLLLFPHSAPQVQHDMTISRSLFMQ